MCPLVAGSKVKSGASFIRAIDSILEGGASITEVSSERPASNTITQRTWGTGAHPDPGISQRLLKEVGSVLGHHV